MVHDSLPPASVDDAWRCVAGDDLAHLFPASGGPCLCGKHKPAKAGELASSISHEATRAGKPYRKHCRECQSLWEARWLAAFQPPPFFATS